MRLDRLEHAFDEDLFRANFPVGTKEDEKAHAEFSRIGQLYFRQMLDYAYIMFEWENLPETIDPLYFEKVFHKYGKVAFFRDDNMSDGTNDYVYLAMPFHEIGYRNINGYPTTVQVRPINNAPYWRRLVNNVDCVIGYNNPSGTPTTSKLNEFAYNIADIEMTKRNRLNWERAPFIFTAPKKMINSIKAMFNKIIGHNKIIIQSDTFGNTISLNPLDTRTEFINDKLRIESNAEWDRGMLFLGIDNTNQDKKERLINAEVEANNEQLIYSRNIMLMMRKEFCKHVNKMFPELNIDVNIRADFDLIERYRTVLRRSGNDNKIDEVKIDV